jgi:signal transduction histidine kinase
MRFYIRSFVPLLSVTIALKIGCWKIAGASVESNVVGPSGHFVTNAVQFKELFGVDFPAGCDFRLTGIITLTDTNRNLAVLQDSTGAVALNFTPYDYSLQVGQVVTVEGENGNLYCPGFPDYPLRPSEQNVESDFESPTDSKQYRLTRMRGYLHPPVTGEYTFWIASDNSSELWLSTSADPAKARKMASIQRFNWVAPREWSRYPSQRSEPAMLNVGETCYIEAISEQTSGGENLAVAWQGPGLNQSLIESRFLTPWRGIGDATNGILRECWTNFSAGDLEGLTGLRPFASALTVEKMHVSHSGENRLPAPTRIVLSQRLAPEQNYRWIQAEGAVTFVGTDGDAPFFELSDGQATALVRVVRWSAELSKRIRRGRVRVEGVYEGMPDPDGALMPGLIWVPSENSISFLESVTTNADSPATDRPIQMTTAVQGFFNTRATVTFNDRVFDKDYVFVQRDSAALLVALEDAAIRQRLDVGFSVDLGGTLETSKDVHIPVLTPLVVKKLAGHPVALPVAQRLEFPVVATQEGRWTEFEGVAHSLKTNGTLSVVGKEGSASLWIGHTRSNCLARFVDAKVRSRGVLLMNSLDRPLLLVPSLSFLYVQEEAPEDPFGVPTRRIGELFAESADSSPGHRTRVFGEVTYRDGQSFFVEDSSGGVRVEGFRSPELRTGDAAEVIGFPSTIGFAHKLTEAQVRPAKTSVPLKSKELDLSDPLSFKQSGTLVHANATLLGQSTNGSGQVLELQKQQRVFVASLAVGHGVLPNMLPGSQIRITGVYDDDTSALAGQKFPRLQSLASVSILLRSPQDVLLVSGAPWWTWRRAAIMAGTLLTTLALALSWVHALRRRLERQHAAQLAFSRQVLQRLEDERRRIAVNLHDSLGQTLMVIKNHAVLAIQGRPEPPALEQQLTEISGATSQAIEEVRQITHGLRPYQLDRLGLTQAIRASVNRASEASENRAILFAIRVEDIDGLFDKDSEIHVYRIVQEAVTNIVKHSGATEAAVVIKKRAGVVSLSIRDNGRGLDPSKNSTQSNNLGYGLSGIAERARILGAALAIDSKPGNGTTLTVEIPLQVQKA